MRLFTSESAAKLQKILSKRIGRELSEDELEQAYDNLIGFAETLIDLSEPEIENQPQFPKKIVNSSLSPVENNKYTTV